MVLLILNTFGKLLLHKYRLVLPKEMESPYLEMLRIRRDVALGSGTCIGQEVAMGDL